MRQAIVPVLLGSLLVDLDDVHKLLGTWSQEGGVAGKTRAGSTGRTRRSGLYLLALGLNSPNSVLG